MARVTPKMGLRVWDQGGDAYDHTQQADNWAKVDYHDHTPGRGVQIPSDGIEAGAIQATHLSNTIAVALLPTGIILPFGGPIAPGGYLLCNGATYDGTQDQYTPLWNVIGTFFGGTGQASFKVPDTRGRLLAGWAQGAVGALADIATLGHTENGTTAGIAVSSRKIKHQHTNGVTAQVQNHIHTWNVPEGSFSDLIYHSGNPVVHPYYLKDTADTNLDHTLEGATMQSSGGHAAVVGGSIGDTSGPVDSSSYLIVNHIIKL